jgi:hypothetical protein
LSDNHRILMVYFIPNPNLSWLISASVVATGVGNQLPFLNPAHALTDGFLPACPAYMARKAKRNEQQV